MLRKTKAANGEFCPLIRTGCIGANCKFWIHIRGKHPQTGGDLDMPDCSVRWLPVLMIETTQQTRQASAAIESFRNEMVRQNRQLLQFAVEGAGEVDPPSIRQTEQENGAG